MHRPILILSILLGSSAGLVAETALKAMKLLPSGEAKRIARIEAREGTPEPARWYFIVHDVKSETGIREYVIASGEVVASRAVSQFAESLTPVDVVGGDSLKIDSDRVAKIAQQYALANNATIATMNYELKKEGAAAAPLWTVRCLDEAGKELGRVVVTAGKGNVVSHDGFATEPAPPATPVAIKHKTQAAPQVATRIPETPVPVATPLPVRPKSFFERVGGSLQKVIPGRKPESP